MKEEAEEKRGIGRRIGRERERRSATERGSESGKRRGSEKPQPPVTSPLILSLRQHIPPMSRHPLTDPWRAPVQPTPPTHGAGKAQPPKRWEGWHTLAFSSNIMTRKVLSSHKIKLNLLCRLDGRSPSPPLLSPLHQPQNPPCLLHRLTKTVQHPKRSKPAHPRWRRHLTLWTSKLTPLCIFSVRLQIWWSDSVYILCIVCVCVCVLVWQGAVRGVFWRALCRAAGVSAWGGFAFAHPAESGHFTPCHSGQLPPQEEELDRSGSY